MGDLPAILTALGALLTAIFAGVIAYRNSKASQSAREAILKTEAVAAAAKLTIEDAKKEIIATKDGVFEVGKQLDGRLTELLRLTSLAAKAEGREEGRADERSNSLRDATTPPETQVTTMQKAGEAIEAAGDKMEQSMHRTADNTAEIADNTAPLREKAGGLESDIRQNGLTKDE